MDTWTVWLEAMLDLDRDDLEGSEAFEALQTWKALEAWEVWEASG